jgi:hypothetical protein
MKISYENRKFCSVRNTEGGEVGADTVFHYHQKGRIVWAEYSGGEILRGQLIADCDDHGNLDMRYQHVNHRGELKTGKCRSTPELLGDGRLRLHERWEWTDGDRSSGESVIEEIS